MMKYDRASNIANAVPRLEFNGASLAWHRLDDGVMGGLSQTHQNVLKQSSGETDGGPLIFSGTINTNGGGFASIRSPLANGLPRSAEALHLVYRGDGKTYKILLSDGSGGGPFSKKPSWQADLPTKKLSSSDPPEEKVVALATFRPNFGGRGSYRLEGLETESFQFDSTEMLEIGLMLSLKLSDGSANPSQTFGTGVFDFKLEVQSIELITTGDAQHDNTCSSGLDLK